MISVTEWNHLNYMKSLLYPSTKGALVTEKKATYIILFQSQYVLSQVADYPVMVIREDTRKTSI